MNQLPPTIHESWHEYLQPLFDDPKMQMIKDTIVKKPYYPSADLVFRVFRMPISEIKIVIIGQDPYPQTGQAIGLAFAVPENVGMPPTLNVIKNEIYTSKAKSAIKYENNIMVTTIETPWRTLQHWVDQGVFLLNSALTVEAKNSGSHLGIWLWFTRQIVDIVSKHHTSIWMLWGAKAQSFESYIDKKAHYSTAQPQKYLDLPLNNNYILKAPHPVAETYNASNPKFTGCNHFNLCNEILQLQGKTQINW